MLQIQILINKERKDQEWANKYKSDLEGRSKQINSVYWE